MGATITIRLPRGNETDFSRWQSRWGALHRLWCALSSAKRWSFRQWFPGL
jgi:hypothetical protein